MKKLRLSAAVQEVSETVGRILADLGDQYAAPALFSAVEMLWMSFIISHNRKGCDDFTEMLNNLGRLVSETQAVSSDCDLSIKDRVDKLAEISKKTTLGDVDAVKPAYVSAWMASEFDSRMMVHATDAVAAANKAIKEVKNLSPDDITDTLTTMMEEIKRRAESERKNLGIDDSPFLGGGGPLPTDGPLGD